MMLRKRFSLICLTVLFISLLSGLSFIFAQEGSWTKETLVTYTGDTPEIDGLVDQSWIDSNSTSYTYTDGSIINLRAQHSSQYLYIIIVAEFINTANSETISLYLSNSDSPNDIMDKKQITMNNATNVGNETYSLSDYYSSDENFVSDVGGQGFEGAATFDNETNSDFRAYEFAILLNPESSVEDAKMAVFSTYAVQIGYTSSNQAEERSSELLLQLGPEVDAEDDDQINAKNFDADVYILIVMIVVSVVFVGYGGVVFASKKKVGDKILPEEEL